MSPEGTLRLLSSYPSTKCYSGDFQDTKNNKCIKLWTCCHGLLEQGAQKECEGGRISNKQSLLIIHRGNTQPFKITSDRTKKL